ncbi:nucleoside-triphosphatase [Petroclostridium sp. X23]|uniref:nucleoside-triphosphatase n=1 Tax=Petroclostridium sp. X23 TaxID=3045146 RepID=UPI0024AD52D2|nr:nucleoside-triphosphatase [Petroclostridium sp. X23]WHH57759.1 nucleoside-triphosphatase [Petroclostridium sp. X23]
MSSLSTKQIHDISGRSEAVAEYFIQGAIILKKIMLTGEIGVGKTTLLNRLLNLIHYNKKIYGYRTEKDTVGDKHYDIGKVYIYPATGKKIKSQANCVADLTGSKQFTAHTEIFETTGVQLLSNIPKGSIVVMDEIGFLESKAPKFSAKIKEIINNDYIVFGVIKPNNTPLLDYIRNNPNIDLFTITPANRDIIFEKIKSLIIKKNY